MRVILSESALGDLIEGRRFYEDQEEAGLGDYFEKSMFHELETLESIAGIHPRLHGRHRFICGTFPYAIYYRMEPGGDAAVLRILDCRRDPRWIKRAIKNS
ncbi:MAG: hypothetical protein JWR15_2737 [Prosthecobacter sp.]|nr:hypothetical protein [Prosthecobacter sp.]